MSGFSMPVTMYPAEGEILDGKFEVKKVLGEGGMGAVAKGWDRELHRDVALKFMSPHLLMMPGAVERFLMEAQAAARVRNDHVVEFFARGVLANGAPFLVMEFLDGRDLAAIVENDGVAAIPVARAVHFTLQILRALQVAHSLNVIHRDMKPSNCFVVHREGEDDFVKVVDFGISKIQDAPGTTGSKSNANLTKTNSALGTPLYMSPEQAKSPRDVDHRTDLYSVSAILYELLTGRTPYLSETGEFAEILVKLLTQEPTPLGQIRPDLPPELVAAVHKGLASERDYRFRDSLEFAEAIAPWADDRSAWVLRRLRSDRRNSMELRDAGLPFMRTAAPGSMVPPATPGVSTVKGHIPPAPTPVGASTPMPGVPNTQQGYGQASPQQGYAGPQSSPAQSPAQGGSPYGQNPQQTGASQGAPQQAAHARPLGAMSRNDMLANTLGSDYPPAPKAAAAVVQKGAHTAAGVTRDATNPSDAKKKSAVPMIFGVVAFMAIGAGAVVFVSKSRGSAITPSSEPSAATTVAPIALPSETVAPVASSAPSAASAPTTSPSARPVISTTHATSKPRPGGDEKQPTSNPVGEKRLDGTEGKRLQE